MRWNSRPSVNRSDIFSRLASQKRSNVALEKKPEALVLLVSKALLSIDMFTHSITALANTLILTKIHFEKNDQIAYLIIYETHFS